MENKRNLRKKIALFSYVSLFFTTTACITVCKEPEIYTAAMVNKSGQKVTVKNVPFNSDIPDFIILAPNDSVSWMSIEYEIAKRMEIYFNDVFYKKYDNYSYHPRDPRNMNNYKENEKGIYVYTFTIEDYEKFLSTVHKNSVKYGK